MIRLVTSCGPEHWQLCGEKFMAGLKHWPVDEIYIYHEFDAPPPGEHDTRVVWKRLLEVPGCHDFLKITGKLPFFSGIADNKRDYRFDIHRFCRKMFAQADAAMDYDGLLYWLDFDTETYRDIPEALLERFLEGNFMARMARPGFHSCASLVGWDCGHALNPMWWKGYYQLYVSGKVFSLPEWHDSYVLDVLCEVNKIPARNLAEGIEMEPGHPTNVFNLVMDGYSRHNKGMKKFREADDAIVTGAGHTFHKVSANG